MSEPAFYIEGDFPRNWTKGTWKAFSWILRKSYRDNKPAIEKACMDVLIYGEARWALKIPLSETAKPDLSGLAVPDWQA